MTDRELLELAAKAAGVEYDAAASFPIDQSLRYFGLWLREPYEGQWRWNSLANNGDAFRLANKLSIDVLHNWESVTAQWELGKFCREKCTDETRDEATRRAITRAAAEIGKAMP